MATRSISAMRDPSQPLIQACLSSCARRADEGLAAAVASAKLSEEELERLAHLIEKAKKAGRR